MLIVGYLRSQWNDWLARTPVLFEPTLVEGAFRPKRPLQ
jgi:hypothetical protein